MLFRSGTGVGDLSFGQLARLDEVLLTHSHLDHVCGLALSLDTLFEIARHPLRVHATEATIDTLRQHLFNWKLWPDFTEIPNRDNPYLRFSNVMLDTAIHVGNRIITPVYANHIVPAVGYAVGSDKKTLVFTGDTLGGEALWRAVNTMADVHYIIIETAFPDSDEALAVLSRHLCPRLLKAELAQLRLPAEVFITHLKPNDGDRIMHEVKLQAAQWNPKRLQQSQVFEL